MPAIERFAARLALVCLSVTLLYGSNLRAAAQEPDSNAAGWLARQTWQQQYRACFDPRGQPIPDKLRALVAAAGAGRAAAGDATPHWEQLALLYVLAGAHRNLREWKQAEEADRALVALSAADRDRIQNSWAQAETVRYGRQASRDLAGIYGMQCRWALAVRRCLWWVRLEAEQNYLPYVGAAYGLLALWWLRGWTNPAARASRHAWLWLVLFASSPLLYLFVALSASLIASAFLGGNPFAVLALDPLYPRVSAVSETVWVVLMLGLSVSFRRREWRQDTPRVEAASGADTTPTESAPRRGRRLLLLAAVTLLGWALQHLENERRIVDAAVHLSRSLAWWRDSGRADAFWVYSIVFRSTLGSWVQELFFRGVIYRYARGLFGMGPAIVFSSCVFAAWHGQPDQFLLFFWTGIVFAAQYEVSGSLIPSTVTHCLHNFLAFIEWRP